MREWEETLLKERRVFDFHIHPYRNPGEYMGMYREEFYVKPEEMRGDLESAGISRVCGSVIDSDHRGEVKSFDAVRALNEDALALGRELDGFYLPGIHVHPAFLRESIEELEKRSREGVRLVGELVPYLQGWPQGGFTYASPALTEILHRAGELGMVVSFHTMPEWHRETEEMLENNPGVTFVAAHPGQPEDFRHHEERLKKYPNLYLDLSGTGLFRYGLLASAVKRVGADRLLFGTDYPICNPRMYVQAVLGEHISDEDKEKILYRNAERLFENL